MDWGTEMDKFGNSVLLWGLLKQVDVNWHTKIKKIDNLGAAITFTITIEMFKCFPKHL